MNTLILAGAALALPLAPFFPPVRTFLSAPPLSSVPAPADGLQRSRLPAEVDFVLHLDLDELKRTEIWRLFREHLVDPEDPFDIQIDELDDFKARFGIDPLTDVRAMTVYRVHAEEDPTVVLFSTSDKVEAALRALQLMPGYARISEGGIDLHTWNDVGVGIREEDGDCHDLEGAYAYLHTAGGQERVVVLASNKESALRAARVLRGELRNHAQAGTLLTLQPAVGSFMYLAAAEIPHLDEFTPASQVFGLAQGIQVDLGEAGGFLNAHMGITTETPQAALDISSVIQGLVSLARLAGSGAGEALELLSGLRFNALGNQVQIDFGFGVQRLIEIFQSLHDEDGEAGEDAIRVDVK